MSIGRRLAIARSADLTLGTLLDRFAEIRGDRLLAEQPDGLRYTYAQAAERVARASTTLRARLAPGDRVVVRTPNGYDLFLACLAVARAGGVAVPVNPRMAAPEIEHVVEDAGAHASIDDFDSLVTSPPGPAAPVAPTDVAVVFYTSGTTGRPKGAQLTHRALVAHLGDGALAPEALLARGCVSGMPVAHVGGFTMLLTLASLGVPVYLLPKFRPDEALDAIEHRHPMMFVGVPAMYRMMLEAGAEQRELSSVRLWSSGADALPDDMAVRFQRKGAALTLPVLRRSLGRATFVDGYGSVELGGGVGMRVFPPVPLPISGRLLPMRGHRMRVVDDRGVDVPRGEVGELLVRGPGVMRGYHDADDATARAITDEGWLHTGDLARAHRFGLIELAGRKKDVIKHGGYSVFPAEVEQVLEMHPAVAEAAVIGVADERKGAVPVAVVRLSGDHTVDPEELVRFGRERLSDYKAPQRVIVVADLPRSGTDKVDKKALVRLFDAP